MRPDAPYDLEAHRHQFAVWAAARAAQRRLRADVATLRQALEQCGVREDLQTADLDGIDDRAFKKYHQRWCGSIKDHLSKAGIPNVTFGRAAKLLAVYLKSVVVLGPRSETALARVAHPPIDSILLRRLAKENVSSVHARAWATTKWTALTEDQYYELIEQLRQFVGPKKPFWMLERYWTVTDEADLQ